MNAVPIWFSIGGIVGLFAVLVVQTFVDNIKFNKTLKRMEEDHAAAMKFVETMPMKNKGPGEYIDGKNRAIYDENGEMIWNTVQGIVGSAARID